MFNKQDEYTAATEYASINTYDEKRRESYRLGIFNLFLLTTIGLMGYVGFDSLKNEPSFLNKINILNTDTTTTDSALRDILKGLELDTLDDSYESDHLNLATAIDDVVNNLTIEKDSFYAKALSKEIDENGVRTIVVQKGDTLASISEKYYGNSTAYDKIIASNDALDGKSSTIFVGQKINLPY